MEKKNKVFWTAALIIMAALLFSACGETAGQDVGQAEDFDESADTPEEAVVSENGEVYVTYPEYTEEEVANGHFTGGFDLRMVLLGFRDKLDRGDYGVDISLDKEADFVLWQEDESGEIHAVMAGKDGEKYAVVTVGDAGIDRFPTLRQVHSFRVVTAEELESCTINWTAYGASAGAGQREGQPGNAGSSQAITAEAGEMILYNANDKDNRVLLEGEDRALAESVLEAVSFTEDAVAEGPLRFVIKAEGRKYLFDWNGAGIKDAYDDGTTLLQFTLSREALEQLEEMCRKYGIYEE